MHVDTPQVDKKKEWTKSICVFRVKSNALEIANNLST